MGRRAGRAIVAGIAFLSGLAAMPLGGGAQTLRDALPAAGGALPEGAFEAAKAAFERLPDEERQAIQEALVWTGDSAATADGIFGRRTFEAIQAYQRRVRSVANGVLDRPMLANLLAAASRVRAGWAFDTVADPATGIRIGLPQKLLSKRSAGASGGTRFQSQDGRVTLDLRALPGGEAELRALYERNLANPAPGRSIGYKMLRPDAFVVSGETPTGRFYTRYAARGDAIRAFSIGYDKALAAELDRVVIAIANSFVPFPSDGPAPPSSQVADIPLPPPRLREEVRPSAPGFTGLAVSARRVLAPAAILDGCRDPLVDGAAARVLTQDRAHGIALLEPLRPHAAVPVAVSTLPAEGAALVVFIAPGEGGKPVAAPAEIASAGRIYAPLQEGAAGGVVLDRTGAVAGMVSALATGARAVAGLVPPASHRFADATILRQLLGPDVPPPRLGAGEAGPLGARAADIAPALVRIACAAPGRVP